MPHFHHACLVGALLSFARYTSAENLPLAIHRDVAIVGGGASGAHAAVRLREDFGKSVVVIEKQSRLVSPRHLRHDDALILERYCTTAHNAQGGHVNTYTDTTTPNPTPYDYGVQSFIEYGKARDFFTRFNIATGNSTRVPTTPRYIDFSTGLTVPYTPPTSAARSSALAKYIQLCETYDDIRKSSSLRALR